MSASYTVQVALWIDRGLAWAWEHVYAIVATVLAYVVLKTIWTSHVFNRLRRYPGVKMTVEEVNRAHPPSFTGQEIQCFSPSTGIKLGIEYAATDDEVNDCIAKARVAQAEWAKTSFDERRAILHDLMDMVVVNMDELARASWLDTGKSRVGFDAMMGEVAVSCEKIRYTIRDGEKALRPEKRSVPIFFQLGGKYAQVEYSPMGVIACIVPWNYPFHNFISHVVSIIFAGNACIVKASEGATHARRYYQELVQSTLRRRGHNPDLVQLIPGYGATGAALVKSPLVAKVLFIGSPEVGKKVMATASETLKPVILELGGKDPFIVLAPCDVQTAVDRAINGSFFNLGQNCISAERIIVDGTLYDDFCNRVVKRMGTIRQGVEWQGQPIEFGSMTMEIQLLKTIELIDDAVKNGARLLHGGKRKAGNGLFLEPCVLADVNPRCRLWTEEAFGPVMLLIPFKTEAECVAIANATRFGLSCSVACNDLKKAERVGRSVESGMLVINDYGLSYMIQDLPFGGVKDSGFGRFNGPEGLREYCNARSVVGVLWNSPGPLGFPSFMRRPLWSSTVEIIRNVTLMFYSWGFWTKLTAALTLVKLLLLGDKKKSA